MKKIITLCLGLTLLFGVHAQDNNKLHRTALSNSASKDITFSASDIQFWCGTGSNQALVLIGWDDSTPAVAYAWGVRWNGNAVAIDLIDSIATHDPNFSYQYGGGLISNVEYTVDGNLLASSINYWCYYLNGQWAQNAYGNQPVSNGDVIEMSATCMFDLSTAIPALDPNVPSAVDATIAPSDILYWVGQGSNELIMAVSWAEPDTALAWGYRFNDDSVTLQQVMTDIQSADPRFSFTTGWGVSDILFLAGSDTLRLSQPDSPFDFTYWWSNVNGLGAQSTYDALYLHNGDFVKWGDSKSGIALGYDEYGYASELVWTTPVHPVSIPTPEHGPFCGAVGTEGCNAIQFSDNRILGWATSCHLELGPTDIANPSTLVSYGDSTAAIGPSTGDNLAVVSLGDGGSATLSFARPIANGEGYDFAVFENSFDDNFLELAFVEVSSDGEHFVRFAATSLTPTDVQVGSYGPVDPTFINNLAGKYRAGWGTPFDLDELRDSANIDINNIRFVRIVDVVGSIDPQYGSRDAFGHIVNDPYPTSSYSGGFDLDAVAVMHFAQVQDITDALTDNLSVYPNPAASSALLSVGSEGNHQVTLFDITGRKVMDLHFNGLHTRISTANLPNGVYMLRVDNSVKRLVVRH